MLDAAGFKSFTGVLDYGGPTPGTVSGTQGQTSAEILSETYKKLGFNLTLEPKSTGEWPTLLPSMNWDLALPGQGGHFDPDGFLQVYFTAAGGRNYTKWMQPEVERLIAQEAVEVDVKKRNELIRKTTDILDKEGPRMPLVFSRQGFAIKKKVQGFWAPSGGGWAFGVIQFDAAWISA